MSVLSIVVFFLLSFSFGYLLTFFVKPWGSALERFFMRVGIGMAVVIVLAVVMNLMGIILDWKIFLVLSLLILASILVFNRKNLTFSLKITKEDAYAGAAVIIAILSLWMYASGAFSYPYLENDDPWTHAVVVSYVAQEKVLADTPTYNFKFLDPYPPGFAVWLGLMHQIEPSISWVLKFYNALFIALGVLFFYFAAKQFIQDRRGALFATFVLASLPSFFTHFIWAHTLSIILFFPALYCLEKIEEDRRWGFAAGLVIAGILLTHPDEGLKILIMLGLYFIVKSIYYRAIQKEVGFALLGGVFVSLLWWATKAQGVLGRHVDKVLTHPKYAEIQAAQGSIWGKIQAYFPYNQGTATRAYTFDDFFIAKPFGMINVHVGWGIVATLLIFAALIYILWKHKEVLKKEHYWIGVALAWFIFTFLGTNSMTFSLPVGLYAFRFWLLLAIPVALLSWLGVKTLLDANAKFKINAPALLIIGIVVVGVFFTATTAKYAQNAQAQWPPGASWKTMEEVQLYASLEAFPVATKIFSFAGKDEVIGMDKSSCLWCADYKEVQQGITNDDPLTLYSNLKRLGYEYMIFEVSSIDQWKKLNLTDDAAVMSANLRLNDFAESGYFIPVHNVPNGGIIFKLK